MFWLTHIKDGARIPVGRWSGFSVGLIYAVFLLSAASALGQQNQIGVITERVSNTPTGEIANNASYEPSISADDKYVVFASQASDLVENDDNDRTDIFVRNRSNSFVERVSISSEGVEANGNSLRPSISADGRYVAFASYATNLVPGDNNEYGDIFVHDRTTGQTERVSVSSAEEEANADSPVPEMGDLSISADGQYVAFDSDATNLVPATGKDNGAPDVFVRNRQQGTTELASVNTAGEKANGTSWDPSISADGRYVAFSSSASDLVTDDDNEFDDVFVRDRLADKTERISLTTTGKEQTNSTSDNASISADGRYVAFTSYATNLVPGGNVGSDSADVFVRDREKGITERAALNNAEEPGNSESTQPSISADGRYVAFVSSAKNLGAHDNNNANVFLRDRQAGTTVRISISVNDEDPNSYSKQPSVSAAGHVAYTSDASNLVPGDDNDGSDIFVGVPFQTLE